MWRKFEEKRKRIRTHVQLYCGSTRLGMQRLLTGTYSSYTILRAVGLATSYQVVLGKPETKSGICNVYPMSDFEWETFLVLYAGTTENALDWRGTMEAANNAANANVIDWRTFFMILFFFLLWVFSIILLSIDFDFMTLVESPRSFEVMLQRKRREQLELLPNLISVVLIAFSMRWDVNCDNYFSRFIRDKQWCFLSLK